MTHNPPPIHRLFQITVIVFALLYNSADASPISTFSLYSAANYLDTNNNSVSDIRSDGLPATIGVPFASAGAQTSYGQNHAFAEANGVPAEVSADSIWVDHFTALGPTQLQLTVIVSGIQAGVPWIGGEYDLVTFQNPLTSAELMNWVENNGDNAPPNSVNVDGLGLGAASLLYANLDSFDGQTFLRSSISFALNTGDSFFLASILSIGLDGTTTEFGPAYGTMDYNHSAHFGIQVLSGPGVVADSGSIYQTANSVPEPGILALIAIAILSIIFVRQTIRCPN